MLSEGFLLVHGLCRADVARKTSHEFGRLAVTCPMPYVTVTHSHTRCTPGFLEKPTVNP